MLIVEGLFFNVINPLTENPVATLLECVKPQIGLDLMQITRHACVTQNISQVTPTSLLAGYSSPHAVKQHSNNHLISG